MYSTGTQPGYLNMEVVAYNHGTSDQEPETTRYVWDATPTIQAMEGTGMWQDKFGMYTACDESHLEFSPSDAKLPRSDSSTENTIRVMRYIRKDEYLKTELKRNSVNKNLKQFKIDSELTTFTN
jgi:hypothetical protein